MSANGTTRLAAAHGDANLRTPIESCTYDLSYARKLIALCALVAAAAPASAQVDARMFRQPAVSADKIAFVYAGDIWLVPKTGGTAVAAELAARRGIVSAVLARRHARSPTAPTTTATSTSTSCRRPAASRCASRITRWRTASIGWHPDGKRVLFASGRESGRQRYNQFYLVGVDGGLPEKLPVPYGEFGAFSPDGDAVRLHADVAGLPQLEALSRRLGAGPAGCST